MVVFWQSGYNQANVVLFGNKSCCIQAKVVVFGQNGCIREKLVVFGQSGCIRAKVVVFGQSGCIRAKGVVFVKVVIFGNYWF